VTAILMRVENTYGNDTHDLRVHFKRIKTRFGGIKKLGIDRFQLLRKCFDPTIEELSFLSQFTPLKMPLSLTSLLG